MNSSPFLLFLFLSLLSTFTFSLSSTLDPKQLRALQSLNVPISKDPCTEPSPNNNTIICDTATPFRHITSLHLTNCSDDVFLSHTALDSLPTLQDFQFLNCPISTVDFPPDLISSLRSFSCIHSLRNLTGEFLNRLENLTDLTVVNSPVTASRVEIIIGNLKILSSVKISESNLTGDLPSHWHLRLAQIDFSGNKISGTIPSSITMLENLKSLDLSMNELTGEIPDSFGDLLSLENVTLASNSMYGSIPDSVSGMQSLVHIDFSSNKLNGTIPNFLSKLENLKYLNLGNNEFDGVLPFSGTFIKKLDFFEIGGNSNLCYNSSTLSSNKIKLGIAPCDEHGKPTSPPPVAPPVISPAKEPSSDNDDDDYPGVPPGGDGRNQFVEPSDEPKDNKEDEQQHHGPSKIFLGLAIGISSVVFLIIFWICISKCC